MRLGVQPLTGACKPVNILTFMAHLLLVDDEESLRSVVAERLTDEGFEVVQAADGESALKALDVYEEIASQFAHEFGRRYEAVEGYRSDDAEIVTLPLT